MSQQPVWITNEGSLGTIPEGKFYKVELRGYDPDFPGDFTQLTYTLIAGNLPDGIAILRTGSLEGIPISIADAVGVPTEISETQTSKFVIRATSDAGRLVDRTFTLTITGQDAPEWITPPGLIGGYFDGTKVDFQFEYSDRDPDDNVTVELMSGDLPDGLVLTPDGLLSGYIEPSLTLDSEWVSFSTDDLKLYGSWPYGFEKETINTNHEFTLQITDGKGVDIRTFSIYVLSKHSLTADSTDFTVDADFITADNVTSRTPYLLNHESELGRIKHDNFWTYQLHGVDPDSDTSVLHYEVVGGELPEGITLDINTGWLSGYLPNVNLTELDYYFTVQVIIDDPIPVPSINYYFHMLVVGDIDSGIDWITPYDLGTINNGEISTLFVEATHSTTLLSYRLKTGTYSKLPQGLLLQPSGNIVGRVSFETFSLDNGATTFDADFETRLDVDAVETTFDLTFLFTVEGYSNDGFISVAKEFMILVNREYNLPYQTLYAKALPPLDDRDIIRELLTNSNIMITKALYRKDDPNFGLSKGVSYQHAFGLNPATLEDYFASFEKNHFHKTVTLGEIKTARALDDAGNVLYEVVYSEIQDYQINTKGETVSRVLELGQTINHGTGGIHEIEVNTVYPNSFENMRDEVVDQIGQVSRILPRWMLSKQENGEVLGFTPAWVIAYTKPTQSKILAFRIENDFNNDLNKIDFTLDRFTLDSSMTQNWDEYTQTWDESEMLTFDRILNLEGIRADSTLVTVDSDRFLVITMAPIDGFTADTTKFTTDSTTKLNAIISASQPGETTFDTGSTRFISSVDNYVSTDEHDKYILYPQVDIIKIDPAPVV